MNISEANAVNELVRQVMRRPAIKQSKHVADAAVLLAENAYKTLHAGILPETVREWASS